MKNLEKTLLEFTREITNHYTIIVMDKNGKKRFTFKDHKIRALENELKKHYGDKIVNKMVSKIRKAETHGTLKNFAVDDSVDFNIEGDKVTAYFREESEEINELSAEIANGKYVARKVFDEQGNIIPIDKLKPGWKEILGEVMNAINKAGLAKKFAPDTGEMDVHLGKGKNLVFLTADDGSKYKYNVASKRLEKA